MTTLRDTITTVTDRTLLDVLTTYDYDVDATASYEQDGYSDYARIWKALDSWVFDLTGTKTGWSVPIFDADPDGSICGVGIGVFNTEHGTYTLALGEPSDMTMNTAAAPGAPAALGYARSILGYYTTILDQIGWPDGDVTDLELTMYDGDTTED